MPVALLATERAYACGFAPRQSLPCVRGGGKNLSDFCRRGCHFLYFLNFLDNNPSVSPNGEPAHFRAKSRPLGGCAPKRACGRSLCTREPSPYRTTAKRMPAQLLQESARNFTFYLFTFHASLFTHSACTEF